MHTIGIAGMGNMGRRMAARLADHGVDVAVWNRSAVQVPQRVYATPAELARSCRVVLTMLTDIEASHSVWLGEDGLIAGLDAETLAIEASTVTPTWTRELAGRVPRFVEGPVVGTTPHAEGGLLTILLGGSDRDVELASDVLAPLGKRVHIGVVGEAMALKLAINALFATQVVALTEVLDLLGHEGLGRERALGLLENTPVFAPVLGGIAALLRAADDAPRFPVALVEKDLRYAAGERPLLEAARQRYADAVDAGHGSLNLHAVHRLLR